MSEEIISRFVKKLQIKGKIRIVRIQTNRVKPSLQFLPQQGVYPLITPSVEGMREVKMYDIKVEVNLFSLTIIFEKNDNQ